MRRLILLLLLASLACQWNGLAPAVSPTAPPHASTATMVSPTASSSPTPQASLTPTVISVPTVPGPYEQYTIDSLRSRTYGSGTIEVVEKMEETDSFTRYLIRYPSDGLTIYGFANVPKGEGPFPVIIGVHGFVEVAGYQTLDYTTPALDGVTQAGYIVIHPNLRGYPPSDNGDNLFRVGMAIDVLNLMALIKAKSGPVELFATASPDKIGLWGHSMGGDIVLRVLAVSSDAKAAVLYASMSGDELKNAKLLSNASYDPIFQSELATSPLIVERISPANYYSNIHTPIQLHHGTTDQTVPIAWAKETCDALKGAGVQVDCIYYPGEGHTFRSRVINQFSTAVLDFYKMYLR